MLSLDGTTLDVQDTEANWDRFGGPGTASASGQGLPGAFPQMRVVARQGGYATSEKALTRGAASPAR